MSGHVFAGLDVRLENPAGLSAIWAEENTRASLFDAMQRKETFATSGPHIKLRFFGGWEYAPDTIQGKDWVKTGYAKGVPMGGDLPEPKSKAPTFIVWAVKDPTSGNLDRIQIVKGWARNGQSFEKIYDVAWAGDRKPDFVTGKVPPIGSSVDIANATYTNTIGNVELKSVWTDPDFDPSVDAFYYARALEIPTPRWTTIQAKQLEIIPPETVPATVQERAWSSPIWYTPTEEAKKGGKPGTLVADLIRQGAQALNDQELTELLAANPRGFETPSPVNFSGFCGARTASARLGMSTRPIRSRHMLVMLRRTLNWVFPPATRSRAARSSNRSAIRRSN
jgi:hypothetical protein